MIRYNAIRKPGDFQHRKPGKGNTVMNTKLKNVTDGRVLDRTFQVGFKLEDVRIERHPYQYLYEDPTGRIFMNQETFEQIPIANDLVIGVEYMKESDIVEVVTDTTDGTILYAEMPVKTNLRVTHSEPGVKATRLPHAQACKDRDWRGSARASLHQRRRNHRSRYARRFLREPRQGIIAVYLITR